MNLPTRQTVEFEIGPEVVRWTVWPTASGGGRVAVKVQGRKMKTVSPETARLRALKYRTEYPENGTAKELSHALIKASQTAELFRAGGGMKKSGRQEAIE